MNEKKDIVINVKFSQTELDLIKNYLKNSKSDEKTSSFIRRGALELVKLDDKLKKAYEKKLEKQSQEFFRKHHTQLDLGD